MTKVKWRTIPSAVLFLAFTLITVTADQNSFHEDRDRSDFELSRKKYCFRENFERNYFSKHSRYREKELNHISSRFQLESRENDPTLLSGFPHDKPQNDWTEVICKSDVRERNILTVRQEKREFTEQSAPPNFHPDTVTDKRIGDHRNSERISQDLKKDAENRRIEFKMSLDEYNRRGMRKSSGIFSSEGQRSMRKQMQSKDGKRMPNTETEISFFTIPTSRSRKWTMDQPMRSRADRRTDKTLIREALRKSEENFNYEILEHVARTLATDRSQRFTKRQTIVRSKYSMQDGGNQNAVVFRMNWRNGVERVELHRLAKNQDRSNRNSQEGTSFSEYKPPEKRVYRQRRGTEQHEKHEKLAVQDFLEVNMGNVGRREGISKKMSRTIREYGHGRSRTADKKRQLLSSRNMALNTRREPSAMDNGRRHPNKYRKNSFFVDSESMATKGGITEKSQGPTERYLQRSKANNRLYREEQSFDRTKQSESMLQGSKILRIRNASERDRKQTSTVSTDKNRCIRLKYGFYSYSLPQNCNSKDESIKSRRYFQRSHTITQRPILQKRKQSFVDDKEVDTTRTFPKQMITELFSALDRTNRQNWRSERRNGVNDENRNVNNMRRVEVFISMSNNTSDVQAMHQNSFFGLESERMAMQQTARRTLERNTQRLPRQYAIYGNSERKLFKDPTDHKTRETHRDSKDRIIAGRQVNTDQTFNTIGKGRSVMSQVENGKKDLDTLVNLSWERQRSSLNKRRLDFSINLKELNSTTRQSEQYSIRRSSRTESPGMVLKVLISPRLSSLIRKGNTSDRTKYFNAPLITKRETKMERGRDIREIGINRSRNMRQMERERSTTERVVYSRGTEDRATKRSINTRQKRTERSMPQMEKERNRSIPGTKLKGSTRIQGREIEQREMERRRSMLQRENRRSRSTPERKVEQIKDKKEEEIQKMKRIRQREEERRTGIPEIEMERSRTVQERETERGRTVQQRKMGRSTIVTMQPRTIERSKTVPTEHKIERSKDREMEGGSLQQGKIERRKTASQEEIARNRNSPERNMERSRIVSLVSQREMERNRYNQKREIQRTVPLGATERNSPRREMERSISSSQRETEKNRNSLQKEMQRRRTVPQREKESKRNSPQREIEQRRNVWQRETEGNTLQKEMERGRSASPRETERNRNTPQREMGQTRSVSRRETERHRNNIEREMHRIRSVSQRGLKRNRNVPETEMERSRSIFQRQVERNRNTSERDTERRRNIPGGETEKNKRVSQRVLKRNINMREKEMERSTSIPQRKTGRNRNTQEREMERNRNTQEGKIERRRRVPLREIERNNNVRERNDGRNRSVLEKETRKRHNVEREVVRNKNVVQREIERSRYTRENEIERSRSLLQNKMERNRNKSQREMEPKRSVPKREMGIQGNIQHRETERRKDVFQREIERNRNMRNKATEQSTSVSRNTNPMQREMERSRSLSERETEGNRKKQKREMKRTVIQTKIKRNRNTRKRGMEGSRRVILREIERNRKTFQERITLLENEKGRSKDLRLKEMEHISNIHRREMESKTSREREIETNRISRERETNRISRERERETNRIFREREIGINRISREREIGTKRISRERETNRISREREMETNRISREREIGINRISREREIGTNRISREREIGINRISRERKRETNIISREREIGTKRISRERETNRISREREIGINRISQKREIGINRISREREMGTKRISREREIGTNIISREREIGTKRISREREIGTKRISREREIGTKRISRERETKRIFREKEIGTNRISPREREIETNTISREREIGINRISRERGIGTKIISREREIGTKRISRETETNRISREKETKRISREREIGTKRISRETETNRISREKETKRISREREIGTNRTSRETEIGTNRISRERETNRISREREIGTNRISREREIGTNRISREREIGTNRISREREIGTNRISREREIGTNIISREGEIGTNIISREREIGTNKISRGRTAETNRIFAEKEIAQNRRIGVREMGVREMEKSTRTEGMEIKRRRNSLRSETAQSRSEQERGEKQRQNGREEDIERRRSLKRLTVRNSARQENEMRRSKNSGGKEKEQNMIMRIRESGRTVTMEKSKTERNRNVGKTGRQQNRNNREKEMERSISERDIRERKLERVRISQKNEVERNMNTRVREMDQGRTTQDRDTVGIRSKRETKQNLREQETERSRSRQQIGMLLSRNKPKREWSQSQNVLERKMRLGKMSAQLRETAQNRRARKMEMELRITMDELGRKRSKSAGKGRLEQNRRTEKTAKEKVKTDNVIDTAIDHIQKSRAAHRGNIYDNNRRQFQKLYQHGNLQSRQCSFGRSLRYREGRQEQYLLTENTRHEIVLRSNPSLRLQSDYSEVRRLRNQKSNKKQTKQNIWNHILTKTTETEIGNAWKRSIEEIANEIEKSYTLAQTVKDAGQTCTVRCQEFEELQQKRCDETLIYSVGRTLQMTSYEVITNINRIQYFLLAKIKSIMKPTAEFVFAVFQSVLLIREDFTQSRSVRTEAPTSSLESRASNVLRITPKRPFRDALSRESFQILTFLFSADTFFERSAMRIVKPTRLSIRRLKQERMGLDILSVHSAQTKDDEFSSAVWVTQSEHLGQRRRLTATEHVDEWKRSVAVRERRNPTFRAHADGRRFVVSECIDETRRRENINERKLLVRRERDLESATFFGRESIRETKRSVHKKCLDETRSAGKKITEERLVRREYTNDRISDKNNNVRIKAVGRGHFYDSRTVVATEYISVIIRSGKKENIDLRRVDHDEKRRSRTDEKAREARTVVRERMDAREYSALKENYDNRRYSVRREHVHDRRKTTAAENTGRRISSERGSRERIDERTMTNERENFNERSRSLHQKHSGRMTLFVKEKKDEERIPDRREYNNERKSLTTREHANKRDVSVERKNPVGSPNKRDVFTLQRVNERTSLTRQEIRTSIGERILNNLASNERENANNRRNKLVAVVSNPEKNTGKQRLLTSLKFRKLNFRTLYHRSHFRSSRTDSVSLEAEFRMKSWRKALVLSRNQETMKSNIVPQKIRETMRITNTLSRRHRVNELSARTQHELSKCQESDYLPIKGVRVSAQRTCGLVSAKTPTAQLHDNDYYETSESPEAKYFPQKSGTSMSNERSNHNMRDREISSCTLTRRSSEVIEESNRRSYRRDQRCPSSLTKASEDAWRQTELRRQIKGRRPEVTSAAESILDTEKSRWNTSSRLIEIILGIIAIFQISVGHSKKRILHFAETNEKCPMPILANL